jgi:hypothetical protein
MVVDELSLEVEVEVAELWLVVELVSGVVVD